MESGIKVTMWYKIKEILRIAYTLPYLLASVVGVAFALTVKTEWLMAFLIPLDVFLLALFANLSNDYFDHKSGVDTLRFADQDDELKEELAKLFDEKVFWSGNSFDRGLITDRQGKIVLGVIAILAILIAVPIVLYAGVLAIILGLIGLALAFFYTAPPVNLGARGFGELDVFVSFTMMAFFSYFVIVQQFSWTMLLLALTIGFTVMLMRLTDEAPGYDCHTKMGEKNLCVRFGLDNMIKIATGLVVATYAVIAVLTILNVLFVALFLTLPIALSALRYLNNKEDRIRFHRAILQAFKLALSNQILIVLVLIVQTVWTSL